MELGEGIKNNSSEILFKFIPECSIPEIEQIGFAVKYVWI